jgi:altronate hydrolase
MAGSGATMIIFSTGLGTPTGNPVAPVVKTATNSILAKRMADIIDFDHGDIITSGKSIEQSAEALLEELIRMASGEKQTAAERLQQDDFIPWKRGVSL